LLFLFALSDPTPHFLKRQYLFESSMEQVVNRLEAAVARVTGGGGVGDGEFPVTVSEYDALYAASILPFIAACNATSSTAKLGAWAETAFKHTRNVIEAATQCKKPADMMAFLGPIVTVITEASNVDNRSATFPQDKAFAEMITCLNWLIADGPKNIVTGALESADFYLNKTLTVARDMAEGEKKQARDFVKTLREMLFALAIYVQQQHKMGLMWSSAGADVSMYKPGQAAQAAGASQTGGSVEGRLEMLCSALESYAAKMGGGGDEDSPACVSAYADFYTEGVLPFIEACGKLPELADVAAMTEKAFKHLGSVIMATTQCKKPTPEAFMAFLGPIVEVITAAGKIDRKSKVPHHLASFNETVQALNFVCMEGAPKSYILGQIDAGSFYGNKVLTSAKDMAEPAKTDHRAWVSTMKALLTALAEYAHKHFKMGLTWKVKDGTDIANFKTTVTPTPVAVIPVATVVASVAAPVAVPKKKFGPGGSKAVVGPTTGKVDTSRQYKVFVEKYDGRLQKEPVVVKIPEEHKPMHGVFIDGCKGPELAIIVEGKIKNITINNCQNIGVVFDNCITTVELINCKKVQVQAKDAAGSYILDKCDQCTLFLSDGSIKEKVVVMTCMSTATNVAYTTEDGEDMVEHSIPDQIESAFIMGAGAHHHVIIPDAE
jgi:adenylyl cyclase-associated protein